MLATFFSVALFSALGASAQLVLYTPAALNECQNTTITWEGTTGPYSLYVVPSDDPCGDALVDFGDIDGTTASWNVNITAGTNVTLTIIDDDDNEAWSNAMTIGSGDSSCMIGTPLEGAIIQGNISSSSSATPSPTTLVVNPEATPSPTSSVSSSGSGAVPVGAAGSNLGPHENGALSLRQFSAPIVILTVLAAALSL